MFGQPSSASPFGTPSAQGQTSAPFGSPAPAFGASTTPSFGAGATPATTPSFNFGGGASTTPAFGSPAPATGFGGGFGSTATTGGFGTPSTGGFGSGGFGATAATNPTGGGLFGAAAPAPAGGLYGAAAPAPAAGGLFGAPAAPTTTFGGFGQTQQAQPGATTSLFGAPAPAAGGLFGAPAPAPATGGLFGTSTTATTAPGASFGFGAAGAGAMGGGAQPGTLAVPWSATNRIDGNSNMNLQAITAMSQYENKSFEELRLEDYTAGNKGSAGATNTAASGGFGSTGGGFGGASSGGFGSGGFGSTTAAPATGGLFGAPAPAPGSTAFGAPAPAFGSSTFGAPAASTTTSAFGTSTFGAPAPAATGGFFGAAAPKPATTGLFGAPAPAPAGGLFGAPAPAPAGGLFGAATTAPAPATGLFGAPAPAPTTGLFGAAAPAPNPGAAGGLFGPKPATGGLFGAPAPAPAGGGLFGAPAPAPAGGLFGATPAPTGGLFGAPAPAPAGGLFGAPAPAAAPTSLFGAPAAGSSFFGAPAPAAPSTSLFGAPAPTALGTTGGLFGAPATAPALAATAMAPLVPQAHPSADALLAQQLAAIENQKKELALLEPWRKGGAGSPEPKTMAQTNDALRCYASASGSGTLKDLPKGAMRIRPRGGYSPKVSLDGGKSGSSPVLSPDAYMTSSAKRLVIQPHSLTPSTNRLLLTNGGDEEESKVAEERSVNRNISFKDSPAVGSMKSPATTETPTPVTMANGLLAGRFRETPEKTNNITASASSSSPSPKKNDLSYDLYKHVVDDPNESAITTLTRTADASALLPKLTKENYEISPSLTTLSTFSEVDLATVPHFLISRAGYGQIQWEGAVDVRGVDLDSVVRIEMREVFVYDDVQDDSKPSVGEKLNRPAVITLENIHPKVGPGAAKEVVEKFTKKLKNASSKMGAEHLGYDGTNGIWTFKVQHFSRYGFFDSDDDDDDDDDEQEKEKDNLALRPANITATSTPLKTSGTNVKERSDTHIIAPLYDSYSEDESSQTGTTYASADVLQAAEDAYRSMMMQTAMNPMYSSYKPVSPNYYDANEETKMVFVEEQEDEKKEPEKEVYSVDYTLVPL
mmetsp:Transcript_24608/g.29686  ORF Transcript_24608/g.29686 Transcript_24608/m.29686 type:complete len:1099 (+) Transcript_24608:250-3546(+)